LNLYFCWGYESHLASPNVRGHRADEMKDATRRARFRGSGCAARLGINRTLIVLVPGRVMQKIGTRALPIELRIGLFKPWYA